MTAHDEMAARLHDAEATAVPVRPVRELMPGLDLHDAYAIQLAGKALRIGAGNQPIGWKVGLTSRAMQDMLGVSEPDFGYLTERMRIADGALVDAHALIAPRVEPEIAFRLAAPLRGPDVTVEHVLAATDAVAPAIELIDSRIERWDIALVDTVADNASSSRFAVGSWISARGVDLADLAGRLVVRRPDGEQAIEHGRGSAVLGHPAAAVAWLANVLAELPGDRAGLSGGDVVLPGAVARAVEVGAGDRVEASFERLGSVAFALRVRIS